MRHESSVSCCHCDLVISKVILSVYVVLSVSVVLLLLRLSLRFCVHTNDAFDVKFDCKSFILTVVLP